MKATKLAVAAALVTSVWAMAGAAPQAAPVPPVPSVTPAPAAEPPAPATPPAASPVEAEQPVVAVYYVGDLISNVPDFPLATELAQPGAMKSRGFSSDPNDPNAKQPTFAPSPAAPAGDKMAEFVVIITETVAPEKWQTGHIKAFGTGLIVSTDRETQAKVADFLQQLRRELGTSRSYTLELMSIVVEPAEADGILRNPDAELDKLKDRVAVTSTSGKSGQVLHVVAGQARSVRTDVTPIVGTNAEAFQAVQTTMLGGISAEFSVQLSPGGEGAKLELKGAYSRPIEVTPPVKEDAKTLLPESFSAVTCAFGATTDLPVKRSVLVSRASLDPSGAKPGQQLLVFARVVPQGK